MNIRRFSVKTKQRLQHFVWVISLAMILMLGASGLLFLIPGNEGIVQAAPMMARTVITPTTLTQDDSTAETTYSANSDGNKIYNDGATFIQITNDYTGTITATFVTPATVGNLAIEDKEIAVSASSTVFAGPFQTAYFNQPTGSDRNYVYINYTTATSVSIGAYRLP